MANSLRLWLMLGCLLGLTACSSPQQPDSAWPSALPARDYFLQQWQADRANQALQSQADYLQWVLRFYEGYNLAPGWLEMTAQVRERVAPAQWSQIEDRLWQLGQRIGAEWSKDNAVRRFGTRAAAAWRDALLEALAQDDLDAYLTRLEQDVAALLDGSLDPEQIRFERYYVDEFDF
jgi:hypothetical protein